MKVKVEWSEAEQVATISHEDVAIASEADVEAWRELLLPQLERLREDLGRKPAVLVCIDGFSLAPAVADLYGRWAKHIAENLVTGLARYGNPTRVRAIVAAEAVKQGYKANLFETRDEARRHLSARRPGS